MTAFPKPTQTGKQARAAKRRRLDLDEKAAKAEVRRRDGNRCRFPLCNCGNRNLEVSHSVHKGMGGDPTGERSKPELMVTLCAERHRTSSISVDTGLIRWRPLTAAGANGPIAWDAKMRVAVSWAAPTAWVEIFRETDPQHAIADEFFNWLNGGSMHGL